MPDQPAAAENLFDSDRIDHAVIALLHLNAWQEKVGTTQVSRAWKSLNWSALDRLHAAGLISDPRGKAQSVVLTEQGAKRAQAACQRLFGRAG
ncbi:MAG: hypothetical protein CHACPFDD_02868 [Phycisphaerae bacterium]|nr:hypothetical protein [Phycisphaerae bacterium]